MGGWIVYGMARSRKKMRVWMDKLRPPGRETSIIKIINEEVEV